jgi:hypothetical protein
MSKAFGTVFKQYDALVTFIRWQESIGAIAPSDALRLLQAAPDIYHEYLKLKLPGDMKLRLATTRAAIIDATDVVTQRLLESYPEFAAQVRNLARGVEH